MSSDFITNASQITIYGFADAGATVDLMLNGTVVESITVNSSGLWTSSVLTPAASSERYTAEARRGGYTSTTSIAVTVVVDSTTPIAPFISSFSPDAGGGVCTSSAALLNGSCATAGDLVKVYDKSTLLLGSVYCESSLEWSFIATSLANGNHSFTATETTVSGCESTISSALKVLVNTTAPPSAPTIIGISSDTGFYSSDFVTNATQLVIYGWADVGSTVDLKLNGTLVQSIAVNASGYWSSSTLAPSSSPARFTAAARRGGYTSSASALAVIVDYVAPSAPTLSSFSPNDGAMQSASSDVLVNGTCSASGNAINFYDGSTLLGSATCEASLAWSYNATGLSDGNHTFSAAETSVSGCTSTLSSTLEIKVDTSVPNVPVIRGISSDTGLSSSDFITNSSSVEVFGTADANCWVDLYLRERSVPSFVGSFWVNSSGMWTSTAVTLPSPIMWFFASARRGSLSSANSADTTVNMVTTCPSAPLMSAYIATNWPTEATLTGSCTTTGNLLQFYKGTTFIGNTTCDGSLQFSCDVNGLSSGWNTVSATETGVAGCTSPAGSYSFNYA